MMTQYPGWKILGAVVAGPFLTVTLVGIFYCFAKDSSILIPSDSKEMPWHVLSALSAVPTFMLLWFWRERHRQQDHANKKQDHANKKQDHANKTRELQIAGASQRAAQFSKAAELLGMSDPCTRLGGVRSLDNLARRGDELDYRACLVALASFVRERQPWPEKHRHQAPAGTRKEHRVAISSDSQEAVLAISGLLRDRKQIGNGGYAPVTIDLSRTDLRWFNLRAVELMGALLSDANLSYANLEKADLSDTDLSSSVIKEANLYAATYDDAITSGTIFDGSVMPTDPPQ